MATYKTPGVYVEEITTLPPSVAEVETAIPAFIGFTETGARNVPRRITSLVEYTEYFGGAEREKNITVIVEKSSDGGPDQRVMNVSFDPATKSKNVMAYSMQIYFANGGGPCYIIPCGNFADNANNPRTAYGDALLVSSREDEPTLLVFPDAPFILAAADYYTLMNDALAQCSRLGDRFAIIDVIDVNGDTKASVAQFRQAISGNLPDIKYGAAYYPYLNTTVNYRYSPEDINILQAQDEAAARLMVDTKDAAAAALQEATTARTSADALKPASRGDQADPAAKQAFADADTRAKDLEAKAKDAQAKADAAGRAVTKLNWADNNSLQNQIKKMISTVGAQLSPCAAAAGVYANVDSTRGVWKAPANVTLNYVSSAAVKVTEDDQRDLNIDVTAGKSVNAIRSFIGAGTKIWGARTLAGNDNEWRYVNVRRFFNMVEESVKKSTFWAVFEPNDINTWTRVRAMIENYLLLKWKDGALTGTKPDEGFFVRVGLGQTMTPQDQLEGRMIIEIGLAAVRPAEFIILRFSHFMQKS